MADPAVAGEWHPTRNGDLRPDQVTAGSKRAVWWRCARDPGHEWQQTVFDRVRRGGRCPLCARAPEPKPVLSVLRPDLVAEWHPGRNGALSPHALTAGSPRVVWWRCALDPAHEWRARIQQRMHDGVGCPYCAGQRTTSERSLPATHPELAAEWCAARNALGAHEVSAGSNRVVWWRCVRDPHHEWEAQVRARARGRGRCPWCSGRRPPAGEALADTHPDLAAEWHTGKNGTLGPESVRATSRRVVWWRCRRDPGHAFEAEVARRAGRGDPGCPECARRGDPARLLAGLAPALAREWHEVRNAGLGIGVLRPGVSEPVWWRCAHGHEWQATLSARARGGDCPACST